MMKIQARVRLKHWFPLKRRTAEAEVSWLSRQGMIIGTAQRLPVGGRLSVDIFSDSHNVRQLPADIVRAEPAGNITRYSLRFLYQERNGHETGEHILSYLADEFSRR